MMRSLIKRSIVTLAALAGVLGLSSSASALSIVLEWTGSGGQITGTNFVGSETVTLEVYAVATTPPGLDGVGLTIAWDSNALSMMACNPANTTVAQYVAGGSFMPFNSGTGSTCDNALPGLQPALTQLVVTYQPYLPGPGSLHVADLVFHVLGAPGNTVVQALMRPGYDGWAANNFVTSLNATFVNATVHVIPEPTTAILVGVGFIGLLAAGRRRRS